MADTDERMPAQVFSLAEMLGDEMEARGWTTDDVAARMGDDPMNYAFVPLLISVQNGIIITDDIFVGLARAFDVSEQYFRNIDAGWRRWPNRQSPYSAPDALFGPIARRSYKLRDNDNA